MSHTVDFLIVCHGQVNHHRTATDCLVNLVLVHVRDEHYTTFELEATWQFVVLAKGFCVPRNDTLAIGVQSTFEQVKGNRVFKDRIAVVEHDRGILILEQSTVQTFRSRVTFDSHIHLRHLDRRARRQTLDQFIVILETRGLQGFHYSVCLAQTTLTGDHCRWLDASGYHAYDLLHETKSLVNTKLLNSGFLHCLDVFECTLLTSDLLEHVFDVRLFGRSKLLTIDGTFELASSLVKGDHYRNLSHLLSLCVLFNLWIDNNTWAGFVHVYLSSLPFQYSIICLYRSLAYTGSLGSGHG